MYILTSTYVGRDHYMHQNLHDIIAISIKAGYVDISLTLTCNPQWPEIENALLPGQSVADRLDLAARVFRIKLRTLMVFVIDEKVVDHVKTYIRVIEFQKRGLSHAHCILFMTPDLKVAPLQLSFGDSIISAENPDEANPTLRQVVLKHNMHYKFGDFNPSAVCLYNEMCTKHFFKQFLSETGHNEAQMYVTYLR